MEDVKGLLDPRGNVVLMSFSSAGGTTDALLYRGGEHAPFVHAHGYDPETGEWSQGRYFGDPCRAYFSANPRIVEESATWWEREDFADALERAGVEVTERKIDDLIGETSMMRGWLDRAVEDGNELIDEAASWLVERDGEHFDL